MARRYQSRRSQRREQKLENSVSILVGSMIGALLVYFIGDAVTFDSTTQSIVDIAPVVLVALGLYGAFKQF